MDLHTLEKHFQLVRRICPTNKTRTNYFIAACKLLDHGVIISNVESDRPFGGLIGVDNSYLDRIFGRFKIFRLHAILHDAAGYMKEVNDIGPGYCYAIRKCPINSCILGHITGLSYCIWVKFNNPYYDKLTC